MVRFSSRLPLSIEPTELAKASVGRAENLLDLTQSNPTAAGIQYPPYITEALADTAALRYQPIPTGLLQAREALSAYYGGTVSASRILLSASTSEAYSWAFKLLCDPGDELLVPRPSYPLFELLAGLESVRPVQYPMHYSGGWHIDFEMLRAAISDRTKAIVFVNPNNPTGSYLKNDEYEMLASICAEKDLAFIVDEVFLDYSFYQPVPSLALKNDVLTLVMSGLSKVSGLPQMKLGWIAVGGPEPVVADALPRLELISDTFLSVGTPVQCAAPVLLHARHEVQQQIRARTRGNLEFLRASGARLLEPEGGWSAVIQVPRSRTEEEWVVHLVEGGVLVQPGFFYDFPSEAFLVLSLLTETEVFQEGVRRIILATI